MLVAEVAPLAPFLVDALPALTILAACLVAVGLIYVLKGFLEALLGFLASVASSIPGLGSLTEGAIRSAEKAVSGALSSAEKSLDQHIAHQLHRLARLGERLWSIIAQAAELVFAIAVLGTYAISYAATYTLLRPIRSAIHTVETKIGHLTHEVTHLEHELTSTVGTDIYPRLRTIEHELDHVIPKEIATTRDLAKAAEAEAAKAWNLVKTKPWETVATITVGALAVALEAGGWGWVKCSNVGKFGRLLCGMPGNLLGDLLGLLGEYLIVTNLCDLVKPLEEAFNEVAAPLIEGVTKLTNESCGSKANQGPPLVLPKYVKPTDAYGGVTIT